jgi:O-antigen/teichoic acid export membrane protein
MACPAGKTQTGTARASGCSAFFVKNARLLQSRVVRAWSASFADQALISAVNFITGVIIGRSCSKDEFGLYMLGLSIVLPVIDVQTSLVSTPYMIYSPHMEGQRLRLYAGSTLLHQLGLSALVTIALLAAAALSAMGIGPAGLAGVVLALAATILFVMFREFVRRISFAHLRVRDALVLDVCVAFFQVSGLIALQRLHVLSAHRVFYVMGGACALVGVSWLLVNRRSFEPSGRQAVFDLRQNWGSGKWVFASALVWTISTNLYPWLLSLFHGTAAAGTWAACLGVVALANVPFVGMQNSLGPQISNVYAREGAAALHRFVLKSGLFLFAMVGTLCVLLIAFGQVLLVVIYGQKYAGNGPVVSMLALGLVASAVTFCFSRALFAMDRADLDFKINLIPLLVLFTLGLWLVRAFGPLGAAIGLLVANFASTGARLASFAALMRSRGGRGAS